MHHWVCVLLLWGDVSHRVCKRASCGAEWQSSVHKVGRRIVGGSYQDLERIQKGRQGIRWKRKPLEQGIHEAKDSLCHAEDESRKGQHRHSQHVHSVVGCDFCFGGSVRTNDPNGTVGGRFSRETRRQICQAHCESIASSGISTMGSHHHVLVVQDSWNVSSLDPPFDSCCLCKLFTRRIDVVSIGLRSSSQTQHESGWSDRRKARHYVLGRICCLWVRSHWIWFPTVLSTEPSLSLEYYPLSIPGL
mmetsp:Transcript_611/g.1465  ORF Transcript_611/g.1465 Transcript_611/m.1465 type:complete len:247 (-) Transcript_611:639-1379(-)